MRYSIPSDQLRRTEALRFMSHADVRDMRPELSVIELPGTEVLRTGVPGSRPERETGTRSPSRQPGPQAAHLLRTEPRETWFSTGPRVEAGCVRARRLYLPDVRCEGRSAQCRSHQALRRVSGSPLRCGEWPHSLRSMPSCDAYLWVARVLAQAPRVEIAAKRMSQEVLPL